MCGDPLKTPRGLNIRQRTDVKHPGERFRMPGHGGIDIVKQPLAHHKGFAGTAFFARATVKTHRPATAVLFHPGLNRHCARQRGGAEQVMSAAVAVLAWRVRLRGCAMCFLAQTGQRVKFP
ncbi:hypothetical protein D3C86_1633890 [compost metagenome]